MNRAGLQDAGLPCFHRRHQAIMEQTGSVLTADASGIVGFFVGAFFSRRTQGYPARLILFPKRIHGCRHI
jgi:hypothetical protein